MSGGRARHALLVVVAAAALAGPPDIAGAKPALAPDAASFERLRDAILPTPAELAWREQPWRASLWEAVVEAQRLERPILLWAMNGHPLGCT